MASRRPGSRSRSTLVGSIAVLLLMSATGMAVALWHPTTAGPHATNAIPAKVKYPAPAHGHRYAKSRLVLRFKTESDSSACTRFAYRPHGFPARCRTFEPLPS